MSKDFKIWGVSYGIIGDLIMGLPVLTYFEKKYPGSYKYWGIEQKCAFTAPLFLNHPLIDKIVISNEWNGFGHKDAHIIDSCDVKCIVKGWKHDPNDWYNYRNQVNETARVAGIMDLNDVLDEKELKPKLYKWFESGQIDKSINTHSKIYQGSKNEYTKTISIWPFSSGSGWGIRCPSEQWWKLLVREMIDNNFRVYHFGLDSDPVLSDDEFYERHTMLSFFDQIKLSLATEKVLATDSGPSWVISAYNHPCIVLLTNWMPRHNNNYLSLLPLGDNVDFVFSHGGCDRINQQEVLEKLI